MSITLITIPAALCRCGKPAEHVDGPSVTRLALTVATEAEQLRQAAYDSGFSDARALLADGVERDALAWALTKLAQHDELEVEQRIKELDDLADLAADAR